MSSSHRRNNNNSPKTNSNAALRQALKAHAVHACVSDVHHYRGGVKAVIMAVETDYLITVESSSFPTFVLSKPFVSLRKWVKQLKAAADEYTNNPNGSPRSYSTSTTFHLLPPAAIHAAHTCEILFHLIESQHQEYFGKLSWAYVKNLDAQRSKIIDRVLQTAMERFPPDDDEDDSQPHPLVALVQERIIQFFLTDHYKKKSSSSPSSPPLSTPTTPTSSPKRHHPTTVLSAVKENCNNSPAVLPMIEPTTERKFRTDQQRVDQVRESIRVGGMNQPAVVLEESQQLEPQGIKNHNAASLTTIALLEDWVDSHVLYVLGGLAAVLAVLRQVSNVSQQHAPVWNAHVSIFLIVAAFVVGRQSAMMTTTMDEPDAAKRPSLAKQATVRGLLQRAAKSSRRLLQTDGGTTTLPEQEEEAPVLAVTIPQCPAGAALGTVTHCWSPATCTDFKVRGPHYLSDKKKTESQDFLFPALGVDLFLTDACPENVGRNAGMLDGRLRHQPTFIINFRLPWGILVFYFEIPAVYVPFVRAGHEPDFDTATLPSVDDESFSPAQRALCRFLQGDEAFKNKTLKIIPMVADGPWIVRQVVGGKPVIIGQKVPVTYVYGASADKKALYLEADLDVAASSAARNVLSVVRTYTSALTLDLGFVVQSNREDELPECMMVGCRLHGVDPLQAPDFPSMGESLMEIGKQVAMKRRMDSY